MEAFLPAVVRLAFWQSSWCTPGLQKLKAGAFPSSGGRVEPFSSFAHRLPMKAAGCLPFLQLLPVACHLGIKGCLRKAGIWIVDHLPVDRTRCDILTVRVVMGCVGTRLWSTPVVQGATGFYSKTLGAWECGSDRDKHSQSTVSARVRFLDILADGKFADNEPLLLWDQWG